MVQQRAVYRPISKRSRSRRRQLASNKVAPARRVRLRSFAAGTAILAAVMMLNSDARSQDRFVSCPEPESQNLVMPPVLDSDPVNKVLQGTIHLKEQFQRMPPPELGVKNCLGDLLRFFNGVRSDGSKLDSVPPAQPPNSDFVDAIPGPTLRARVGDRVQLTFINEVDANRFDRNDDINACVRVGEGGKFYPKQFDKPPNCLHASSTANIHFHGTHTNPNSAGDNVFLQIRPLPRDKGELTTQPAEVTALFAAFFTTCAERLKDPLSRWPTTWEEVQKSIPGPTWIDKQAELLEKYEKATRQPLWTRDQAARQQGLWPQYYIGAYPYCFVLPEYTAAGWPPLAGSKSPIMGQAPGTHWYHAHKHGSTAINVQNGMTGAFIIEGQYDDELNEFYKPYRLAGDREWKTRDQPILVLNQLGTDPSLTVAPAFQKRQPRVPPSNTPWGRRSPAPDFSVNGRTRPILQMQPGEIKLWRIINTSGRSAAYFMAPTRGLQWRQFAQDGIQFADERYQNNINRPFYLAPGNRADLLVKAPLVTKQTSIDIRVQDVMARANLAPTPVNPTDDDPLPGTVLMRVNIDGPPVTLNKQPAEMNFPRRAWDQPPFLVDITDEEWAKSNFRAQTLVFNSGPSRSAGQHTINGIQFDNGKAHVGLQLGAVEEWTIKNTTATEPGFVDHPFHIHINPFQITEFFDPNENLTDQNTGQLIGVKKKDDSGIERTFPIARYITKESDRADQRQCFLNPADETTWKPCGPSVPATKRIWWDVFAIPSGRKDMNTGDKVIPGYFKMRSRFVDYPGQYVLHCHILIHEDRGMMFTVNVSAQEAVHYH
jgi:FtsP/CotA-like multicopper oxidase with cupredoxin domain